MVRGGGGQFLGGTGSGKVKVERGDEVIEISDGGLVEWATWRDGCTHSSGLVFGFG